MLRFMAATAFVLIASGTAQAECLKCEKIRKYHEVHPEQNYEYYEDYLKDFEEGKVRSSTYPGENDEERRNHSTEDSQR